MVKLRVVKIDLPLLAVIFLNHFINSLQLKCHFGT